MINIIFYFDNNVTNIYYNEFFDNMGISSYNILLNIGSMVIILTFITFMTIFTLIFNCFTLSNKK
jgi:hypothetical protein